MPTLPQRSTLRRLALLRRVPFWAQALALCALFAIVGVAIVDDYGVTGDEIDQRQATIANAGYIATGDIGKLFQAADNSPVDVVFRYYGVAFDMSLLLAERALGLQDSRDIYLTRHLLTHLFFIAGGFVCGMLAYRMLGSRWIALLAMLLFLLHPRLYAHSFFNIKDIPFAVAMVIALYLTHRAFRRDTLGAFLLCGIGVGLAISLRPFGLTLLPVILAMRAPDLWQAGRAERNLILLTSVAFLAAALGTAYIVHPYYWENPLRFFDGLRVLSQHPTLIDNLFMGEIHPSDAAPWNYIPVWFAITAPPLALALGAIGCAAVCWQCVSRPLAALRDREIRFRIMLLGCVVLPVAVVIALQANIYNGWRQMYFLWGPFCLLAAIGLHRLANDSAGGIWKVGARLPGWTRGGGRPHMARRALAYGAAGVGLITTLTAMAALHPHQQVYFNALVDTKTPGALAKRYDTDYWQLSRRQLLEYLLARYPDGALRVWPGKVNSLVLPKSDRERLLISRNLHSADYHMPFLRFRDLLGEPMIHSIEAYDSGIAHIFAPKNLDAFRATYDDVAANGTPLTRGDFDIYIHNDALHYLSADCEPLASNDPDMFLQIVPVDPADLPADSREHGFEDRVFQLNARAAFFDGKCIARRVLPDYPIARIATGHRGGGVEWRADIDLAAAAQALYDSIAARGYGQPAAQSDFDVYLRGGGLAYLKRPCEAGDTDARFFLHIFPSDTADLPADSRESGFANLDFQFADHGSRAGDTCAAERDLPGYAIERIRTGQFVSGAGRVWGVEFPVAR